MFKLPSVGTRRARLLCLLLAAVITFHTVSCGTILYPERRGQPAGRLDPTVILLDGLLLLFFFVPGVIAFAVDFSTGAIYLPPYSYGCARPDQFDAATWTRVDLEPHELTPARIEQVVLERTGKNVRIDQAELERHTIRGGKAVPVMYAKPTSEPW